MEAINFIKRFHKKYLIEVNNEIEDDNKLNYNDYQIIYLNKKDFDTREIIERKKLINYSNNNFMKYIKRLNTTTSITLLHKYNLLFIKINNEMLINKILENNKQLLFNMYVDKYLYNEKINTNKNKTINKVIRIINKYYKVDCKNDIKKIIKEYLLNLKLKNMELLKLNEYDYKYNIIDEIAYTPNKEINNKIKEIINNDNIFIISLTYSDISTYEISMNNLISIIKILKNKLDYLKMRYYQNISRYNQLLYYININNITSSYEINELLNYYVKIHYIIIFNETFYIYLNYQPFYILYYMNILSYSLDIQNYIMEIVLEMCKLIIKRLIIKLSIITQRNILNEITEDIDNNEIMKEINYKEDMKENINMIIEIIIKKYNIKEFRNCIINDKIIIKEEEYKPEGLPLRAKPSGKLGFPVIKTEQIINEIDQLNVSYNLTTLYSYIVNILKYKIEYNEFINYMITRKIKIIKDNNIKKINYDNKNKEIKYFNINLVDIINKINKDEQLNKYEIIYYYSQNPIHQQIYYFKKENILIYQIKDNEVFIKFHNKYYNDEYVKRQNMIMIYKLINKIKIIINEKGNKEYNFINENNLEKMIKENIKKNIKKEINILIY